MTKLGYYVYDGRAFISKQEALNAALVKGDLRPSVEFEFNSGVFGAIDWKVEPPFNIEQLYADRARQLRATYSYLILMFSGGVDSYSALRAFTDAGVFLDEVQTYYPIKALERIAVSTHPYHPLGTFFEYELAAKPVLEHLSKTTKTKITVVDTTDHIRDSWNDKYLARKAPRLRINSTLVMPMKNYLMIERVSDSARSGTAVIFGSDRPKPFISNGELCFCFVDEGRTAYHAQAEGVDRFTPEQFYWTPDLPLIPIKQMHLIRNSMLQGGGLLETVRHETAKRSRVIKRKASELVINGLIYPRWSNDTYQKQQKNDDDAIADLITGGDHRDLLRDRLRDLLLRYGKIEPAAGIVTAPLSAGKQHLESRTFGRAYSVGRVE